MLIEIAEKNVAMGSRMHSPLFFSFFFKAGTEISFFGYKQTVSLSILPTWNSATNCWTLLWAITTGSARPRSRKRPGSGTRTSALVSRSSLSRKSPRAPAKMQCMSTGYRSISCSSGSHRPLTYSYAGQREALASSLVPSNHTNLGPRTRFYLNR